MHMNKVTVRFLRPTIFHFSLRMEVFFEMSAASIEISGSPKTPSRFRSSFRPRPDVFVRM